MQASAVLVELLAGCTLLVATTEASELFVGTVAGAKDEGKYVYGEKSQPFDEIEAPHVLLRASCACPLSELVTSEVWSVRFGSWSVT